jgi:iron complex outermembrane recepter protein
MYMVLHDSCIWVDRLLESRTLAISIGNDERGRGMSFHRYVWALVGAILALSVGVDVFADAPSEAPGQAATLDEVVVTARKREEALKDVPIAVSAVTTDALQEQQYNEVRDVAQISPGLNITTDSPARAFISMRGIGDTLINSVQPGVGIFIDGIYQPNTAYLNSPLVDVARIEVLRGPQGTLLATTHWAVPSM